ncbi:unnamed protein product, partial [marine sediment metagenome]
MIIIMNNIDNQRRETLMPEKNEIVIYTTPEGKETFE